MHIKLVVIVLFLFVRLSPLFAQNKELDSLKKVLPTLRDTAQIYMLIDIGWKARNIDPLATIAYTRQAFKLAKDSLKREDLAARALNYLGVGYRNIGNYKQALETFFSASKLSEKYKLYEVLGYNLQSIGDIYNKQGKLDDAIPYVERGLNAFEKINNMRGIGYCYYTLGQIYDNQKKHKEAIKSYTKSLSIRREMGDKDGAAAVTNRLGIVHKAIKDYKSALQYHVEALQVYEKLDSKRNIVWVNLSIAQVYRKTNRVEEAIYILKKHIPLAQKAKSRDYLKDIYGELSACYAMQKNYLQAYEAGQLFITYKDSALTESTLRDIEYLQIAYDKEKNDREMEAMRNQQKTNDNEQKIKDNRAKNQLYFIYSLLLGLLFISAFVYSLIRGGKKQKQANKLLAEKNEEILSQRDALEDKKKEIEQKNEYISSSISYAKTIQQAILPTQAVMDELFPEHFIFYSPKDVVSGDFYWLQSFENAHILVVADCTGHGVAGAFMTLIAGTLLDKITYTEKTHSPQEILNHLHEEIKSLLHQEQTGNNNGMDAVVLHLSTEGETINATFCGAKNSLYYLLPDTEKVLKLAGDRKGVGGLQNERIQFQNQSLSLPKGSMLYFGSDGLEDQNNEQRKRVGETKLMALLSEMSTLSIEAQKVFLENFLAMYMQNTKQRDDILWMGVRL